MRSRLAAIRDGALDRAVAEPENARYHLAFAGAVDAVDAETETLPVPILVSMAAIPAAKRQSKLLASWSRCSAAPLSLLRLEM